MDKYSKGVLDCATKLDAMVESYGQITKYANLIVENQSQESTIALLKKLSEIADSDTVRIETKKMAAMLKDSLVRFYGHNRILEICDTQNDIVKEDKNLDELMNDFYFLLLKKSFLSVKNNLFNTNENL